nr:hypothetical protein [Acinetobacter sp. ANC 4862]
MKFILLISLAHLSWAFFPLKEMIMNAIKSFLAIAVVAFSANVSAQIVFVPDFPAKKAVKTVNADQKVSALEPVTRDKAACEKAA